MKYASPMMKFSSDGDNKVLQSIEVNGEVYLTGKTWYERFKKELKNEAPERENIDSLAVLIAAQRASGLSHDE